ncbi:MAG: hypothetical protein A3I66_06360 [Burkholderiales bacterium RIFCSPLOWO2_02_FULL_57_36]|nr:MAG: hypothetical protein A3I66_06360 [Burkholderiales bacterium RIFCSPLOWO2_02_FULL_57_36]
MSALASLSSLRIAPDDLGATVRAALGQPLRREGTLPGLCVTGIVSCLANAGPIPASGRTGLIWGSTDGARIEIGKVLDEICLHDGLPMPFDFIACQSGVAAVYASRFVGDLACGVYMRSAGNVWPQLLCMALCWLVEGRYDRVLCGWVDEADPEVADARHASDWILLANPTTGPIPLAHARLIADPQAHADRITDTQFVPSLQTWIDAGGGPLSVASDMVRVEFLKTNNPAEKA